MIRIIIFCFFLTFTFTAEAQIDIASLKHGDLLFQDLNCGGLCDAIESVTEGIDGRDFSHCGIIAIENDSIFALEAIGPGVIKTPIQKFISRSGQENVVPMRLEVKYQKLIPDAIEFINAKMSAAYDDVYDLANDKYYCSELLYEAFKKSNDGKALFPLNKMTFKNPKTGEFDPAWVSYFRELGVDIPEGEDGINPGAISRSSFLVKF